VRLALPRASKPTALALILLGEVLLAIALGVAAYTWLRPVTPPPGEGGLLPAVALADSTSSRTFATATTTSAVSATATTGVFLRIPRCGIDEAIHQGVSEATLELGIGHFPSSAAPGANGNCALAAHGAAGIRHGAPFERLSELKSGDEVFLHDGTGRSIRYVVASSRVVNEHDLGVLRPTTDDRLTLITCVVPSRVTHERLVVTAIASR
jgi:LPXTG-site transpeptidase (sortase) family protein